MNQSSSIAVDAHSQTPHARDIASRVHVQVPGPELCAAAGQLTRVSIDRSYSERTATSAEAAAFVASTAAMPALQMLCTDAKEIAEVLNGVNAASMEEELRQLGSPGVRVCDGKRGLLDLPDNSVDVKGLFRFSHSSACA